MSEGTGGGRRREADTELKTKTPHVNVGNNTCRGNCGRVHVCQFCLSPKHNRHACPQQKNKDTGAAASAGQEATH